MAKRWYVLHVFSGSEKKVAQLITEQAESNGLDHQIEALLFWSETFPIKLDDQYRNYE